MWFRSGKRWLEREKRLIYFEESTPEEPSAEPTNESVPEDSEKTKALNFLKSLDVPTKKDLRERLELFLSDDGKLSIRQGLDELQALRDKILAIQDMDEEIEAAVRAVLPSDESGMLDLLIKHIGLLSVSEYGDLRQRSAETQAQKNAANSLGNTPPTSSCVRTRFVKTPPPSRMVKIVRESPTADWNVADAMTTEEWAGRLQIRRQQQGGGNPEAGWDTSKYPRWMWDKDYYKSPEYQRDKQNAQLVRRRSTVAHAPYHQDLRDHAILEDSMGSEWTQGYDTLLRNRYRPPSYILMPMSGPRTRYNASTGEYDNVTDQYNEYITRQNRSSGERGPTGGYYSALRNRPLDTSSGNQTVDGYWQQVNADRLQHDYKDLQGDPEYERLIRMLERRQKYYGRGKDNLRYYTDQLDKLREMRKNMQFAESLGKTREFQGDGTVIETVHSALYTYDILEQNISRDELGMLYANLEAFNPDTKKWEKMLIQDPRRKKGGSFEFFGRDTKYRLQRYGIRPIILRRETKTQSSPFGPVPVDTTYGNIRGIRLEFTKPGRFRIGTQENNEGAEFTVEPPVAAPAPPSSEEGASEEPKDDNSGPGDSPDDPSEGNPSNTPPPTSPSDSYNSAPPSKEGGGQKYKGAR